ncbi:transposase [Spirosoma sp. HMF4905]|uniref:Transposase n=1 Tax=Spirosoma arboris TaxID=2682092 RepID=A0A7K1S9G2_9BACT|nr:transposase [Spirosoma arboris]MVM30449.1 transposase [Spirosoma arboris]
MKTRRQYDDEFKRMAVELVDAKVSLKVTAQELGITPQILTRWRRERGVAQGTPTVSRAQVSQEQQEILRLKKDLKQAELEREILKSVYSAYAVE